MGQAFAHLKQAMGKDSTIHDGVRHLHIDGHSEDAPNFDVWFHPDEPQQNWWQHRLFAVQVVFSGDSILPTLDLLTILDAHLDLSTVLTLYVTMFPSPLWSQGVWTMLSRIPGLKTLIIGEAYPALPEFLEWWEEEVDSPMHVNPCFPSLSKLVCENLEFVTFDDARNRLAPILIYILENQVDSAHPLQELHIKNCSYFRHRDCLFVQQAAPGLKLIWDEEGEDSDEGEDRDGEQDSDDEEGSSSDEYLDEA